jgi:dihydroorotate dehydrogenase (NAD+) catalytic subunit
MSEINLSVDIGGIILKNPVMTASGTFGFGAEFADVVDLNRLGGIIVKGLSIQPAPGNPPPRIVETPCGMLNAIGLENVGVDAFIREKLPMLESVSTPVFTNIYGKTIDEYARIAARLDDVEKVAGLEVNVSCPNVTAGGVAFGVNPEMAASVVRAVKAETSKPVIIKLSPNVTDVTVIARSVEDAGADAVSLINTITGMAIDIQKRVPVLANITGGLSGPAIRPVAVRMVWQTARAVRIPVIGIGGIMCAADALEFIIAGASAVQIGTANFVNPGVTMDIIDGITRYLKDHDFDDIHEVIGSLKI